VKATHALVLILVAAIVGAAIDRLLTARQPAVGHNASFEVRDVKWVRTEEPTFVSHRGSARIVGKGEAATGRYLVLFEFIRSQRVNPADPPDTTWGTVLMSQGSGQISGDDRAYGCNWSRTIKPPACTPEFRDLVARWQVAGWVRLAEPEPDSSRSH
jgi:hypothetical protein